MDTHVEKEEWFYLDLKFFFFYFIASRLFFFKSNFLSDIQFDRGGGSNGVDGGGGSNETVTNRTLIISE